MEHEILAEIESFMIMNIRTITWNVLNVQSQFCERQFISITPHTPDAIQKMDGWRSRSTMEIPIWLIYDGVR